MIAIWCAVKHLREPIGIYRILECGCSLGAQCSMINWAIRVAFNVDYSTIFHIDIQATTDCTIGADTMHNFRIANTRDYLTTLQTESLRPGAYLHGLCDDRGNI